MTSAEIKVSPVVSGYDQPISIRVVGVNPNVPVTLAISAAPDVNAKLFFSYAYYVTDDKGLVDVSTMTSEGGMYKGVEPMGLFWTLTSSGSEQEKNVFRHDYNKSLFMKLDPTTPVSYTISLHSGHQPVTSVTEQSSRLLASTIISRVCMAEGCQRIPVTEGRLRGTLFVPRSTVPRPAILDLYGAPGGLREVRAALMASHGYVTLALAYFNHPDLPKDLIIELDYFLEALEYLQKLPSVSKAGLGILGRCYGGAVALHLAAICPQVKAVVNMNGGCYLQQSKTVTLRGQPVYHHSDFSLIEYSDEGFIFKPAYPASYQHCIPIEMSAPDCQFLLLYGDDDQMTTADHGHVIKERLDRWDRSRSMSGQSQKPKNDEKWPSLDQRQSDLLTASKQQGAMRIKSEGQGQGQGRESTRCKLLVYPQTGHMMESPFTPPFRSTWNRYFKTAFLWGGTQQPQAHAQEDAWTDLLDFFATHLPASTSETVSKL